MSEICFFYDYDYPSSKGGGENRLFQIANHAMREGSQVRWVCFNYWEESSFSHVELGIKHIGIIPKPNFYNNKGLRNKKEPILYLINCFLCIPYFLKSKKWIIGQWPMVNIIPLVLLGLLFQKKIYVEWWETLEQQWFKRGIVGRIGSVIEYFTLKMSSFVTFVVDCEKERELLLAKNPKAKVELVPNGVDINLFKGGPKNYKFDFVSFCRLVKHKRVDLFIKATRKFINDTGAKNIKVAIIGEGPEKEKLITLAKSLKLENNITFFGFIENYEDIASNLLASKIGVLTSVAGGGGSVVISELFAAELPVIALGSDEGIDPRYIKESVNGFITKSISSEELAYLMIKIHQNEKKLLAMKKQLAAEKHNLDWNISLQNHPVFKS